MPLRSVLSDARLSSVFVIHVHNHKEIDFNEVISNFAGTKKQEISSVLVIEN